MDLNQVDSLKELQLHGIINGLNRELEFIKEQNSKIKLKMDSIVERAELAERELSDRDESIYKLMSKLIACEAKLLTIEHEKNQNLQFLALTEEVQALTLSLQKKEMENQDLKHQMGLRVLQNKKVA